METKILVYDADCPFCCWYTGKFIQLGLLSEAGRKPYQDVLEQKIIDFDIEKAKNKIALLDPKNQQVFYGIDSLLHILGQRYAWMERIGKWSVIHFLLTLLYSFISYNRKLIAPSKPCETACACEPSKNWFWRILFILVSMLVVHLTVTNYFHSHFSTYLVENPVPDFVLFLAQLVFQGIVFYSLKQRNGYDYLGQLSFISLFGALLLLFFHLGLTVLTKIGIQTEMLSIFCYGMVYWIMFQMHFQRVRLLGFSSWLTLSWFIFRLFIYPLVFQL
jgi:hypothetical protein